jgi:hypothetical protein
MTTNTTQPIEDTDAAAVAEDLLLGKEPIRAFAMQIGLPETFDPYYARRTGWPIGKMGTGQTAPLAASKRRLIRHVQKLIAGKTTP